MNARIFSATTFFIGSDISITNAMHGTARGYWIENHEKDQLSLAVMDDYGDLVKKPKERHRTGRAAYLWGDQPEMPIWFHPSWQ